MGERSVETEAALGVIAEYRQMLEDAKKAKGAPPFMQETARLSQVADRFEQAPPDQRAQMVQGMDNATKRKLAQHLAKRQGQR